MIFFLTSWILFRMTMGQNCEGTLEIALCPFEISADPISHFALISKLGETFDSCVSSMKRSKIASGVYCKDIQFCGLGFDLTQDYTKQWNRDQFQPAQFVCQVLVDKAKISCDEMKNKFHASGLFSGKCE